MMDFSPQVPVELNPLVDIETPKAKFAADGRAQIKDVLSAETAGAFFKCLNEEIKWRVAYNDGAQVMELTEDQVMAMNPQQQQMLHQSVYQRAALQFQYAYLDYPAARTINDPNEPRNYVHQVLEFINTDPFLDFIKEITGLEGKLYADGHATCFSSGNFLTVHDDRDTQDNRAIAYVFNMTPNWRPDWGANLEFYDDEYNIVESFVPTFNRLNIFKVPQPHAVTFVPPYATARRLGMTGWFYHAQS